MYAAKAQDESLRLARPEISRLVWAFGISLALHLICYGGYKVGKQLHIVERLRWPQWLQKITVAPVIPKQPAQPVQAQEVPLMFVDVSPHSATTEAPKNSKFYSDENSVAANPEASLEMGVPKISGKQTQVAKAEDTPRSKFDKLQPDFAALQQQRDAEASKPKSTKPPGDLVMAKPDVTLRQDDGFTEHSRPRTIKEALLRQNRTQLMGDKLKQDGGVSRNRIEASFDAKSSLLGAYDAAFIEAVTSRWYDLLDQISYNNYRNGHAVIRFRLHFDGRVTDVMSVESTVGDMLALLCQKAIVDPAPYDKWTPEMRQTIDKDYREITFTFYYN